MTVAQEKSLPVSSPGDLQLPQGAENTKQQHQPNTQLCGVSSAPCLASGQAGSACGWEEQPLGACPECPGVGKRSHWSMSRCWHPKLTCCKVRAVLGVFKTKVSQNQTLQEREFLRVVGVWGQECAWSSLLCSWISLPSSSCSAHPRTSSVCAQSPPQPPSACAAAPVPRWGRAVPPQQEPAPGDPLLSLPGWGVPSWSGACWG